MLKKEEGDFKRWLDDAVFVGGKGVKKLQSIFASIPTLLKKKVLLIFSGKGGLDAVLKKIFQKQKNPKHYDDLNVQCVREDKKLCANEMPNFALNHNKEKA